MNKPVDFVVSRESAVAQMIKDGAEVYYENGLG